MKKLKFIFIVLFAGVMLMSLCACNFKSFVKEDFSLEIIQFENWEGKICVKAEFSNHSTHDAVIWSSGIENDSSTIIDIILKDEEDNIKLSVANKYTIKKKSTIEKEQEFDVASGTYKVMCFVSITCNGNAENGQIFNYSVEKTISI